MFNLKYEMKLFTSLSLLCATFQRYLSHMLYHDDKSTRDCTCEIHRIRAHCHAVASCYFSLNIHFFDVFGTRAVYFHSMVNVIGNQFVIIRTTPAHSCIREDGEKKKILYSFWKVFLSMCKWFERYSRLRSSNNKVTYYRIRCSTRDTLFKKLCNIG